MISQKTVVVVLLVLNALFWGLASHQRHCMLVPFDECPPHWVHVYVMGMGSFFAATYVAQNGFVTY